MTYRAAELTNDGVREETIRRGRLHTAQSYLVVMVMRDVLAM